VKLYGYWRSSASYRLRIALNLKGVEREEIEINLLDGEHRGPEYLAINPQGLVPVMEEGGRIFGQSLAILEYLEETHPDPPLLPGKPIERARVRQLALVIACEIHPLQNSGVRQHLRGAHGFDGDAEDAWLKHWILRGLAALEALVAGHPETGAFCHGDTPTLADICLVPQLYNARRGGLDLGPYPSLVRIDEKCLGLDAFARAAPEQQPHAH
jgi:maleylacetoacetate isomerase